MLLSFRLAVTAETATMEIGQMEIEGSPMSILYMQLRQLDHKCFDVTSEHLKSSLLHTETAQGFQGFTSHAVLCSQLL